MKRMLFLFTLVLLASAAGFADIPRPDKPKPRPQKSIETNLHISLKRDATEARLIIPKSQIRELRAALDGMDENGNTAVASTSITRTQTIVSGMFLSLALVFGGIWFVRSGTNVPKAGKTLVALVVMAAIGSAATYVYANAGPPAEARQISGKMFSQAVHIYKFGYGSVKLETTDETDGIQLIVPDPPDKDKPKTDEE